MTTSKTHSPAFSAGNQQSRPAMRSAMRAARAGLRPEERDWASRKIADTVVRSSWFRRSTHIACYLPTEEEVDTWPLIDRAWRMKKRIFAPVIGKKFTMRFCEVKPETALENNRYGLPEPVEGKIIDIRALDLVFAPVVAFDADGNRLGMGGGYFDRAFAFLKHRKYLFQPKLIGLAFSCQRVEKITPSPWDIRVFQVVDENS